MTQDNKDNNDNKVTVILAIGLIIVAIGVSIGLLYILNKNMKTQQPLNLNNKFNGLNNLNNPNTINHNNELWNVIRDDNGNLNITTLNNEITK